MLSLIGASAGFAPAPLRTSALHVAPRFPVSMKLEEESNILVKSLSTLRGVVTPTRIEQPSAASQTKKEEEKEVKVEEWERPDFVREVVEGEMEIIKGLPHKWKLPQTPGFLMKYALVAPLSSKKI